MYKNRIAIFISLYFSSSVMKYTIEIDDNTKGARGLLEVARALAAKYKSVRVSKIDQEAREDRNLGLMIEEGMKSGLADKQTVLHEMGVK